MVLSYDKFKNTVPKETMDFVQTMLPLLEYYKDAALDFTFDYTPSASISKTLFISLYCLNKQKKYSSFLGSFGFHPEYYKISKIKPVSSDEQMYSSFGYVFDIFKTQIEYKQLSPLDIVEKWLCLYINYINDFNISPVIFKRLFDCNECYQFLKKMRKKIKEEKKQRSEMLKRKLYDHLPISVIAYLETANKIFSYFYNSSEKTEIYTIEDKIALSLFFAIFYDNAKKDSIELTEQQILSYIFKGMNVKEEFSELQNDNIEIQAILQEYEVNVDLLEEYFVRFLKEGKNENKKSSEVTILSILENVLDRDFSQSMAIEHMLLKYGIALNQLFPLEEKRKEAEKEILEKYKNDFYRPMKLEIQNYTKLAEKIYIWLQKNKNQLAHLELLQTDENVATLSLFIAIYYFEGDAKTFLIDHGISLETIFEFFEITLKKEEIEMIIIPSSKQIIDVFSKLIFQKANHVDTAIYSLYNRSDILGDLFQNLSPNITVQKYWKDQVEAYIQKKKNKEIKDLKEQFFKDMSPKTIEYLENVSRIHSNLIYYHNGQDKNSMELCIISLILCIFMIDNGLDRDFLFSHLSLNTIKDVLNIDVNKVLYDRSEDILLLETYYKPFIFGGGNEQLKRESLSVLDILKNIFDRSIYDSVYIRNIFFRLDLTYQSSSEFYNSFKAYETEMQQKIDYTFGMNTINHIKDNNTKEYLYDVLRIHRGILKNNHFTCSEDIVAVSLLLALFPKQQEKRFLEKNELSETRIYYAFKLDQDAILKESFLDFSLFTKYYVSYFPQIENMKVSDIIKKLFDRTIKSSVLPHLIQSYDVNYKILKQEIETMKDYESSLTLSQRIELLKSQNIDSLQIGDVNSILSFGDSLTIHGRYIYDELPKLLMNDSSEQSVQNINQLISETIVKPPKNWLSRLLNWDEPSMINLESIEKIKEAIEESLRKLKIELLNYDMIRKYMEVYYQKNYAHLLVLEEEIKRLEQEFKENPSPDGNLYTQFLVSTSHLQIIKDKANRFRTSNQLIKQELWKINRVIVTHFMTINALEMARDDLFPLIGCELELSKGMQTENEALEISQSVMNLFQALLMQNTESAKENMEKLKQTCLPERTFQALNQDVNLYLTTLNETSKMEEPPSSKVYTKEIK